MPRLRHSGVLELSDGEFETLVGIFDRFPEHIMLASTYMAIQFRGLNVTITDGMIAELIKQMKAPKTKDKEKALIDKILEFRSQSTLTIE